MSKKLKKLPMSPGDSSSMVDLSDYSSTHQLEIKDPLRIVKRLKKALEGYEKQESDLREHVLNAYKMWTTCKSPLPKCCPKYRETITWMMLSLTELESGSFRLQKLKLPSYTDIAKAERYSLQQKAGKSGKRVVQKRTCKNAAVLREKEHYENIILKTKEWILEADGKRRILIEFGEKMDPFIFLSRTLYSHSIDDVDMTSQLWMDIFPNGLPSQEQIAATMSAMEEANKIRLPPIDDNKERGCSISEKVPNEDNRVTICCNNCKTIFVVKEEEDTENHPDSKKSESKKPNESPSPSPSSPQVRRHNVCAWEENIKSQAWWKCSSSGDEGIPTKNQKPPSPVAKPVPAAPVEEASVPDYVAELEEELWESEEEEGESEEAEQEQDEDYNEDQDDTDEELQEEAESHEEISRSTLLQRFKEFSEKFKLPDFKFQQTIGWKRTQDNGTSGNCSVACQTEFVDVDDDDLFGDVDPSILLFEVEDGQGDYKNSPVPVYNKVKPAYPCVF